MWGGFTGSYASLHRQDAHKECPAYLLFSVCAGLTKNVRHLLHLRVTTRLCSSCVAACLTGFHFATTKSRSGIHLEAYRTNCQTTLSPKGRQSPPQWTRLNQLSWKRKSSV